MKQKRIDRDGQDVIGFTAASCKQEQIFEPQIKADEKRMAQIVMLRFETLKEAEKG